MAGPIRISVLANASQATRTFDTVSTRASSMASNIAGAGRKIAAGLAIGAAGAVALGKSVVSSASDAQQSLGATETVFGKYADTVIKRSKDAALQIGLSANEFRELSNVTGALLQGAGVPLQQTAQLTDNLNRRAADMAATFGGTTREAVEAISSLLKGAGDPVEKYGVSIRQADINARLAAQGQDKLTGAARKQAEITARVDLLMQSTAKSAGAFGRESGTLANQQQKLGAQIENLKAKIGTALLPILTRATTFINSTVIPAAAKLAKEIQSRLAPVVDKIRDAFTNLLAKLQPVGEFLRRNPELIKGAAIALGIAAAAAVAFAAAMGLVALATSPITLTVLAVAALGAAIAYAYKNSETFRNVVETVRAKVVEFAGYMQDKVIPAVVDLAQRVGASLKPILDQLAKTFQTRIRPALQIVADKFVEWAPTIKKVAAFLIQLQGKAIALGASIAGKVLPPVIKFAGFLIANVVPNIVATIDMLAKIIGKVIEFGKAVVDRVKDVAKFVTSLKAKFDEAVVFVRGIPGRITSALGDLKDLLYNAGRDIIQGLLDGIGSMISSVTNKLKDLTSLIPKVKGPPDKDRVLLRPAGRSIIQGLIDGFEDGRDGVTKSLAKITRLIEKQAKARFDSEKKAAAFVKAKLKGLREEYDALTKNGKAQDRVTAALGKQRDKLRALRNEATAYARTIKDAFTSYGNVVGLGANEDGSVSVTSLVDQLKDRLARSQRYAELIKQLRGKLNATSLQQIIDAGVDGGLATAEAIASGGSAAIKEINALASQITNTGAGLGKSMAQSLYGAGIRAAEGIVKGLQRQAKALDRIAERMAKHLVKQLGVAVGGGKNNRSTSARTSLRTGVTALEAVTSANSGPTTINLRLTSEQVSQLQRGREIAADLDVFTAAGGRRAS
jgi:phage-related protein